MAMEGRPMASCEVTIGFGEVCEARWGPVKEGPCVDRGELGESSVGRGPEGSAAHRYYAAWVCEVGDPCGMRRLECEA